MMRPLIRLLVLSTTLFIIAAPSLAQAVTNDILEYDVTVVFLGLMSFDFGPSPASGNPVTVLIPNVPRDMMLGPAPPSLHVPRHVTYFLADRDAMPLTEDINDDYSFEETDHTTDTFHYLPFSGFHISIDEEHDVSLLNPLLKYDLTGCGVCPTNDPNGDGNTADSNIGKMCWLSSMNQVLGVQTKDDAHFARRAPMLSKKTIASRMVLRYGTLNASVVAYDPAASSAPKWDFKRAGFPTVTQALAQEVHWNFRAKGVPFVLNLAGIEGPGQRVAFQPKFPVAGQPGKLFLLIGHTTPADAGPIETDPTPAPDEHYAVYYRFIHSNPMGLGPIPAPALKPDGITVDRCNAAFISKPILNRMVIEGLPLTPAQKEKNSLANLLQAMYLGMTAGDPAPGGLNCSANRWP